MSHPSISPELRLGILGSIPLEQLQPRVLQAAVKADLLSPLEAADLINQQQKLIASTMQVASEQVPEARAVLIPAGLGLAAGVAVGLLEGNSLRPEAIWPQVLLAPALFGLMGGGVGAVAGIFRHNLLVSRLADRIDRDARVQQRQRLIKISENLPDETIGQIYFEAMVSLEGK